MANADPKQRLQALDVMRGATILAMILVNNPGTWGAIYDPLEHATWHGWTPTDLIFPFFLFMVGVAMAYAFRKYEKQAPKPVTVGMAMDYAFRKYKPTEQPAVKPDWTRILRRTLTLVALGLLLNAYGSLLGAALGRGEFSLQTLRLPGVLQRIGLAYFGGAVVVLLLKPWLRVVVGLAMLLGYAALLMYLPADADYAERFSPEGNVTRAVDIAVLGKDHMYTRATSEPTEPEGLLSTLPSIVTVLLGYAVGKFLQWGPIGAGRLAALALIGAVLTAAGVGWDAWFPEFGGVPINKKLWTSSFVLLTAGLGTLTLTVILALFDWLGARSKAMQVIATAFTAVGVNAITAFVLASLTAATLARLRIGDLSVHGWLYQHLFVEHLGPGEAASLAMAVATVLFWWAVMLVFYRLKWVVRV